ncbi:MAG: DM13 domain-containing protein [Marmoricola sp.]
MQMKALLVGTVAAFAAAGTLTACGSSSTSPSTAPATASSPASTTTGTTAMATRTGTFSGLNGKKVAGHVTVHGSTLTLTGYSSDQGPDLHVYLANGTSESAVSAGVQISKVASDQMSQTFTLPSGVNAAMYSHVVIHCDKAKAVFGAATLS